MNFRSMALAVLIAIAASTSMSTPAAADIGIRIINHTKGCAWITVYTGSAFTPWSIINGRVYHPQFLKPNGWIDFSGGTGPDVKVRAEFKKNPDCSGPTIADISDYRKNRGRDDQMSVRITDDQHGYHITFK